jgi:hypothetical protein
MENMTGQAFHPSAGRIIGRQDEDGNVVLIVDPATLPPEISDALCRICKRDTVPGMSPEQSLGVAPYSFGQNPAKQGG